MSSITSKAHLALSGSFSQLIEPSIFIDPYTATLTVKMSNPESTNTSRSASPSTNPTPAPQNRLVSGSLKDRIAKFNNPSATPLLPTHPFGTAGPGSGPGGGPGKKGLYGNRIPTLDPKSAGHIPTSGSVRKISENRGLIGNRIPSSVSGGSVAGLASANTGGSNPVPSPKPSVGGIGRPASPSGSIGSSTQSALADSGTPSTSRSSSPPTSPGGGLPPSLLAATLPDIGGPGAMTPSSTRADAGEEQEDRSAPSTPVVGATIQLPPAEYDLVPGNLKLATAAQMSRGLSATSAAPHTFAPSVTSSLASQYDPSSQGAEEKQMMQDVSGISTPTGTPRAAYRELDGSARGEGSTRGEGSVFDEGSVVGDGDQVGEQKAMESVSRRLEGLALQRDEAEGAGAAADRERYEGMEVDDQPTPSVEDPDPIALVGSTATLSTAAQPITGDTTPAESDSATKSDESTPPAAPSEPIPIPNTEEDEDPNKASDLDALKRGDLVRSPAEADVNPLQSLSGTGYEKPSSPIASSAKGEHRDSVWSANNADASSRNVIEERNKEIDEKDIELGPEMVVRPPSPGKDVNGASVGAVPVLRRKNPEGQDEIEVKHPEEVSNPAGTHDLVANLGNEDKDQFVNEAFGGDVHEPTKEEEEGDAKDRAAPGESEKKVFVGPGEVSAEDKLGKGQSVYPDGAKGVEGDLGHPDHERKGEDTVNKPEGKAYKEELEKVGLTAVKHEEGVAMAELGRHSVGNGELPPLHFEKEDGRPVRTEGELPGVFDEDEEKDKKEADDNVGTEKEDDDLVELPTSDGTTIQVPKKMEDDEGEDKEEGARGVEVGVESEGVAGSGLKTKSEEPILDVSPSTEGIEGKKPLQVQVEPLPTAQPADEPETHSDPSEQKATMPQPEFEITSSPNPTSTNSPPTSASAPVFPETPHTDPTTEDNPPLSARSFNSASGYTDRSSTPLDPSVIKAFPDVPDEEHPRVQIHVSPQVTPAKSGMKAKSVLDPSASAFMPGRNVTQAQSHEAVASESTSNSTAGERPSTPRKGSGGSGSGALEVDQPEMEGGSGSLSKRRSVRRSPKSPLLDDEDPGDYVPGEEGWAVVTKGRDD